MTFIEATTIIDNCQKDAVTTEDRLVIEAIERVYFARWTPAWSKANNIRERLAAERSQSQSEDQFWLSRAALATDHSEVAMILERAGKDETPEYRFHLAMADQQRREADERDGQP